MKMDAVDWSVLRGCVYYGSLEPPNKMTEMVRLEFSQGERPSQARAALEALVSLHEISRRDFRETMKTISPHREYHLRRLELQRDSFPSLYVELATMDSLLGALQFFQPSDFRPARKFELCLRIWTVSTPPHTEAELLTQLLVVMELVKDSNSPFDVTGIAIDHRNCHLTDEVTTRLATRVNKVVSCDHAFTPVLSVFVSLNIISLLDSTGEFFQSLCRVGCEDIPTARHDQLSRLDVSYGDACDPRVLAMFSSALAYSRGFAYVGFAEDLQSTGDALSITALRHLALAVLCRTSGVRHLGWFKNDFSASETAALEELFEAVSVSQGQLGRVLWDREWTKPEIAKCSRLRVSASASSTSTDSFYMSLPAVLG